ncbi:MAG: N-acetylmuramoyl-L-alanine amidase [Ferruginibacter sp.]
MYKFVLLFFLAAALSYTSIAQQNAEAFIKTVEPTQENNKVSAAKQFIIGSTCKDCTLSVNGVGIKVYPTGAFAYEVGLVEGDTTFNLIANGSSGKIVSKKISYKVKFPEKEMPVTTDSIAWIQSLPAGNLLLRTGDIIQFKVKALPAGKVSVFDTPLYELPTTSTAGMPGIYQGNYIIKPSDNFNKKNAIVSLRSLGGNNVTATSKYNFTVMNDTSSDIAVTTGRLAYLEYGLGDDRLGGAKIGYLDSMVQLKIIGKVDKNYKIQLAKNRTAYIPQDLVTLMAKGTFVAASLTGSWRVSGDSAFDYVSIGLSSRLPYQSFQQVNPSKIVVDIFGATNNTNWITQLQSAKEILAVDYEQVADDIFRVYISLKNKQHWGHQVYYRGNNLIIKIKQQPKNLSLRNITIAVDAGHGGSNMGAMGPTGVLEKNLTLAVALKLQKSLEAEGAKVIMSRSTETNVENKDRILKYRDSMPDLLVSVHLNSAGDPIRAGGTSTLYRYIGFQPLSAFINKRMLELGLKEYGNIGSFNFALNSPTEYPNALVETLFISNPEEEMQVLDETFQQKMADKILLGIKDFLVAVAKN